MKFENMQCYIRFGLRLTPSGFQSFIQLANISTRTPRIGTFTRLVTELIPYGFPILLENVLEKEWERALIARHGWRLLSELGDMPSDLILEVACER